MLPVDARVDAECRGLQLAVALQNPAVVVDQQQVAGGQLRPVLAEGVDQEGVRPLRWGVAEVITDPLIEIEVGGQPQGGRQIDPRLGQRVIHGRLSSKKSRVIIAVLLRFSLAPDSRFCVAYRVGGAAPGALDCALQIRF